MRNTEKNLARFAFPDPAGTRANDLDLWTACGQSVYNMCTNAGFKWITCLKSAGGGPVHGSVERELVQDGLHLLIGAPREPLKIFGVLRVGAHLAKDLSCFGKSFHIVFRQEGQSA